MHHFDFLVGVSEGLVYIDDFFVQNLNHIGKMHILSLQSADKTGKFTVFFVFFLIYQNGSIHILYFLEKLLYLWEEAIVETFFVELNFENREDLFVLFLIVVDNGRVAPLLCIFVKGVIGLIDLAWEGVGRYR